MRQNPAAVALLALALIACSAPPASAGARPVAHLVLITVDGLRPDAIAAAPAKNLQRLLRESAQTLDARTVGSPETLPSHVNMVTGLAPASHGITYNKDRGDTLDIPSLFSRVRESGGATALLFGKSKMVLLAGKPGADTMQGPGPDESNWDSGADQALAARFAREFPDRRYQLALIHLRAPDYIGHKKDWMSADYLAAVRDSDTAVGMVLDAIRSSGLSASTAVILTSDHGGDGHQHVRDNAASETIPWLCYVPGIKPGPIAEPVRTVDVAPTALALLGLPPLKGIDGKTIRACLP